MGPLFKNDLNDEFGTWQAGYIPYGGADFGEVRAVGAAVGDGDDEAFCDAWCAAADRLAGEAAADEAGGRRASARDGWLRAASLTPPPITRLFGAPVRGYLASASLFTLEGRAGEIRPTLLTAESAVRRC